MASVRPKVLWRDTGLTPLQVITHKSRGVIEIVFSVGHLYPRIFTTIVVAICLVSIGGAWAYVQRDKANLSLMGSELNYANAAYSSIHSAEDLMENFDTGSGRTQAAERAQVDVSLMTQAMKTPKGRAAASIFTYYLNAVKALPLRDAQCAAAKMEAHRAETAYEDAQITNEELVGREVDYFKCSDERAKINRLITACKQEAFTLVTGTAQPPVSLCIYRHDFPEPPRQ